MGLISTSVILSSLPFSSRSSTLKFCCYNSKLKFQFGIGIGILTLRCFSSLRTKHQNCNPKSNSAPWLVKWPSSIESPNPKLPTHDDEDLFDPVPAPTHYFHDDKGRNAIERVVLRLRNLGLASDDEEPTRDVFLRREWVRPDATLAQEDMALPWEKEEREDEVIEDKGLRKKKKKKKVKAQTLAELTLGEEELSRLRTLGMQIREKVNIPKAGLTQAVIDKIHHEWSKNEVVKLKFHEILARDMKLAHQIFERRTRGLVIWKSGSFMWVYRSGNYEGPTYSSLRNEKKGDDHHFVPDVSADSNAMPSLLEKSEPVLRNHEHPENMTVEEAEFNRLLDGLGPRFGEWWGTGILPVDADLLPPVVPGYKTPLRLLPTGMRPGMTDDELTSMRKLSKSLPCHFALGRNRNLQGLACAILELWEKSLVAKIAVKRGLVNTNNELMAGELKKLTGGTLLLRNKYYIVIYRGKDFVPTSVAAVLVERQELTKQVQDIEEKVRCRAVDVTPPGEDENGQAGSLAEFYEAQARWGRDISTEEREQMVKEAAEAKNVKLVRKIERKLAVAQAKRLRAENLLAKLQASMVPTGPDYDQETITDEERARLHAVALGMKAYLLLGIRGVFGGVIENMHLHWRHRELVKLITKQKNLAFVEDTARFLEFESGGILVAIDRIPKGFSLIYYRGKNYRRPITLRPRNLLTKAKALKRSIAMQQHEALSQHITELVEKIEEMKKELGLSQDLEPQDRWSIEDRNQTDHLSEFTQSEDEDSDGEENSDWDDDDSKFSNLK
ncbi:CRM-domain containing factor CFM3, chloroplastic/mitochondrial-like [Gastrolobium bilobum]|uniref:CRM-domain containing factor CFM3, chloroplastic/mitochondrial-like n=1 Tax=Gastrolobium bilobum TaxID=150636 RepID=UPI002AB236FF|nr:CRM-domain containing factor CFM3, chloroplastic/mitochondrial-like [Gastrolobium bilobum]XP_061344995.1 CRM-domain containing factor CFM3, chloroplastic/mitochondrial-like [Gastrolobium bilobum]